MPEDRLSIFHIKRDTTARSTSRSIARVRRVRCVKKLFPSHQLQRFHIVTDARQ